MQIVERLATPEEFRRLRTAVGWTSPPPADCERALRGSLAGVCAVEGAQAVAMGRLVGDGAMQCFAVDVVVDPAYQGRGLGRAVVERLEAVARRERLGTHVDLVAAPDVEGFYGRLGYESVPSRLLRRSV